MGTRRADEVFPVRFSDARRRHRLTIRLPSTYILAAAALSPIRSWVSLIFYHGGVGWFTTCRACNRRSTGHRTLNRSAPSVRRIRRSYGRPPIERRCVTQDRTRDLRGTKRKAKSYSTGYGCVGRKASSGHDFANRERTGITRRGKSLFECRSSNLLSTH